MVAGFELALVLRARGGSNFLVHSRGINARTANEATREAASVLTQYAESGGRADTDESGDNPPSFTFGDLLVDCGRLRVVYRLVGGVLLMGVLRRGGCVLRLLRLLDAATRLLVAAARTVDVTPDKLARRYPEVYLALAALVEAGGGEAGRALAAAEAELAALAPDAKGKARACPKPNRSVAAKGRAMLSGSSFRLKVGGSSGSQPGPAAAAPATGARKLAAATEELGRAPFVLPAGALQALSPPPPGADDAARRGSAARMAPPAAAPAAAAAAADPFAIGGGLEALLMGPSSAAGRPPQAPGGAASAAADPFAGPMGAAAAGLGGAAFASPGPGPLAAGAAEGAFAGGVAAPAAAPRAGLAVDPFAALGPLAASAQGGPGAQAAAAPHGAGPGFAEGPELGSAVAHAPDNPWTDFDAPAHPAPRADPAGAAHGDPHAPPAQQNGWAAPAPAAPAPGQGGAGGSQALQGVDAGVGSAEHGMVSPGGQAAGGPARAPTAAEARALADGGALALRETYRAAFAGDRLTRAGTCGEVVATGAVGRVAAQAAFRLAGPRGDPPGGKLASAAVRAALLAQSRARRAGSGGTPGAATFIASLDHADGPRAAFLQYRLPAVACAPPLLLRLAVRGAPRAVMLEAQLAAAHNLPGALQGLVLDLDAPAALGELAKASPRASWAPEQRRLRWRLPELAPGGCAIARAVFRHDGSIAAPAMAAAARGAAAAASFRGPPGGGTLSGVALESSEVAAADAGGGGAQLCAGAGSFQGRVTAQPAQG